MYPSICVEAVEHLGTVCWNSENICNLVPDLMQVSVTILKLHLSSEKAMPQSLSFYFQCTLKCFCHTLDCCFTCIQIQKLSYFILIA